MGFGNFDVAAMAVWTKVLSDAEIESLRTTLGSVIGWKALGPVGLWRYKQLLVTEEVPDDTGNGANQSARTGTTVLEEEPPFPYEKVEGSSAQVSRFLSRRMRAVQA